MNEPENLDDIVAAVLGGAVDRYGDLVAACYDDVWQIVCRPLWDQDRTNEVLERVYLDIFKGLERYRPGEGFEPWARRMACTTVRSELRRGLRVPQVMNVYREQLLIEAGDTELDPVRDECPADTIQDCLARLPEQEREIIRLLYAEGLGCETIAKRLNQPRAAIRTLLNRARDSLRGCLQQRTSEQ